MTSGLPDAVARVSAALEGAQFALVFGSFGTPSFGPESDLDVAVSFPRALPAMDLVSLAGRLETAAGRRVDVVDLRRADPIIAMQVLRNGRPILVAEPRALAEFQMYTPSRYFDWKITRRPIEEAMRASAAEMNQHFEEDFVLAKDLSDLEEFANEVLRKTTASG